MPPPFRFENKVETPYCRCFEQEAEKNGIRIYAVNSRDQVPATIAGRLGSRPADSRICVSPSLKDLPWSRGDNLFFGTNEGSFEAGISMAQAAVAQTGALVLVNHLANPSSIGFLSKDHIFVLNAADIRATMTDILGMNLTESNAIHFIAGPSSTADIGGKLLTGVHGPNELSCVLVREVGPE
jgi:hypothetical protein